MAERENRCHWEPLFSPNPKSSLNWNGTLINAATGFASCFANSALSSLPAAAGVGAPPGVVALSWPDAGVAARPRIRARTTWGVLKSRISASPVPGQRGTGSGRFARASSWGGRGSDRRGQGEVEGRALAELALDPDASAVRRDDALGDRQAEPRSFSASLSGLPVGLEESR